MKIFARLSIVADYNSSTFINAVMKNPVIIDKNFYGPGEHLKYGVFKLIPSNFDDSSKYKKFFEQLKDENKYGDYCTVIFSGKKPSISRLPIFGHNDYYVTKFFSKDPRTLIQKDLRDRNIGLLKRANEALKEDN